MKKRSAEKMMQMWMHSCRMCVISCMPVPDKFSDSQK